MPTQVKDLWTLVLDQSEIDPADLTLAIEEQVRQQDLDFRSRLLIRDALNALQKAWGQEKVAAWLAGSPLGAEIKQLWSADLGEPGFPSLRRRIVEATRAETIRRMFRELGQKLRLRHPLRLDVGGSGALILLGYLSRRTEDVDVVDELPAEIRSQHKLLDELAQSYNLVLAHFQSRYLPSGWDKRAQYFDTFGEVRVYLVDAHDIFLSKLFSIRDKDKDDLRTLSSKLDKDTLARRLKETCEPHLATAAMRQRAEQNWYVLFGEKLPS